jgi:hypothetical protein
VGHVRRRRFGGAFVLVSSDVGMKPIDGLCHYVAAKIGVRSLAQSLAKELGAEGIRANSLHPGPINTDMTVAMEELNGVGRATSRLTSSSWMRASASSRAPRHRPHLGLGEGCDFLEQTRRRNPELIRAAVTLHQAGEIPSNTFVFDADAFARNGALLRTAAREAGLKMYFMTKQHGRNPELFRRVVRDRARETVAVAMEDARILHRHRFGPGHVGNLVQVPRPELEKVRRDVSPRGRVGLHGRQGSPGR